jgi:hypothetical protein
MAANIPKLNELYTSILSDLEAQFSITIPLFGKNYLRAQALVQAGKMKLFYLSIANLQKNVALETAEPEAIGGTLERFGFVKLGRRPFVSTQGVYNCLVTFTPLPLFSVIMPANTTFKSNDDSSNPSKLYILDAPFTFVDGVSNIISLRALEGGLGSKLNVGDKLTLTAPIANIDDTATVTTESTAPLAAETTEDYRAKAIETEQLEPQGGAGSDYRLWSKDVQGIKQSYAFAKVGAPNEVELFVEATLASSSDGKGTPSTAMLLSVEGVVEFDPDTTRPTEERGRRPLGLFNVDVKGVTIKDVDVEIKNYQNNTPAKQATIFNALNSAIKLIRPFVSSVDILSSKNDLLDINKIVFEILKAEPGSFFESVELKINGIGSPSNLFSRGDIPVLNTVIYV